MVARCDLDGMWRIYYDTIISPGVLPPMLLPLSLSLAASLVSNLSHMSRTNCPQTPAPHPINKL